MTFECKANLAAGQPLPTIRCKNYSSVICSAQAHLKEWLFQFILALYKANLTPVIVALISIHEMDIVS